MRSRKLAKIHEINQSINQSLFAAISKYSTTVVNRQLWTGQWGQSTNHCSLKTNKKQTKLKNKIEMTKT